MLSITNLSDNTWKMQAYFNYIDWNKNSKYFMISGVQFYTADNLNGPWVNASQVDYTANDGTLWYMKMNNPTTFQHTSQDGKTTQAASFVDVVNPSGLSSWHRS